MGWFGPERRATAMALYLLGSFVGQIFLNLVGPLLVANFNWRFPFIAFGFMGMLTAFAYLRFGKEAPRAGSQQKVNISDVFKLFRNRFMWLCGVIQYARAVVLQGIAFWLPTFLIVDRGLSLQATGLIIALRALFIGPSSSIFINCYFGPQFALPLEVLGSHTKGTTTGVSNFFANLGAFSFVYLLGALRDASGSFASGFYAITGVAVIGLVFTILVARARHNAMVPMR